MIEKVKMKKNNDRSKMMKTRAKKVKVLSGDDIKNRHNQSKKVVVRLIICLLLSFLGVFLYFLSSLPLAANKAVPLNWVLEANANGLNSSLLSEGLKLLANGKIEVIPGWISWVFGILGTFFIWLAFVVFQNRSREGWFGNAFKLSYWRTFYLLTDNSISKVIKK